MPKQAPITIDLRPWSAGDLPLLARLKGDAAMAPHLGGQESLEDTRERLERYIRSQGSSADQMFVIVAGKKREDAGSVGYWQRIWRGLRFWETGWSILPEYQGRGIATRAAELILARARNSGRTRYLHTFPAADNPFANAICKRMGFEFLEEIEFEHLPGHLMRCNDWRVDLFTLVD